MMPLVPAADYAEAEVPPGYRAVIVWAVSICASFPFLSHRMLAIDYADVL